MLKRSLIALLSILIIGGVIFAGAKASIEDSLVYANGKQAKNIKLNKQNYIAFYFSAHWCPPCRKFTPVLVDFYKKNKKKTNFEVIFYSYDKSEKGMYDYMKEMKMLWPAVKYDMRGKLGIEEKYAGRGIPHLVVVDNKGEVVSNSLVDGKYVGPYKVLEDLEKLLKGKK